MLKLRKIRSSREENRANTRLRLLESARQVFAKNGYAGASVDLISENVGYSKGAFYSNFESKESLFISLLAQHKEEEIKALEALVTSSESIEVLFDRIGRYYSERECDIDWCLLSAEFQIQAGRDPAFAKYAVEFYRDQRVSLGRLIAQSFARANRKLPAGAEELAAILMGLSIGLSLLRAADQSAVPDGLMGQAILLVLKSMLTSGIRGDIPPSEADSDFKVGV